MPQEVKDSKFYGKARKSPEAEKRAAGIRRAIRRGFKPKDKRGPARQREGAY